VQKPDKSQQLVTDELRLIVSAVVNNHALYLEAASFIEQALFT